MKLSCFFVIESINHCLKSIPSCMGCATRDKSSGPCSLGLREQALPQTPYQETAAWPLLSDCYNLDHVVIDFSGLGCFVYFVFNSTFQSQGLVLCAGCCGPVVPSCMGLVTFFPCYCVINSEESGIVKAPSHCLVRYPAFSFIFAKLSTIYCWGIIRVVLIKRSLIVGWY